MRYWVYINDKVIEKPFEEGELKSIPGFNADTLICKEIPAEGETQEWVPAKNLIAAYKQPAPPPPPTQQNINKFNKQESTGQETQATILSGNIFGSPETTKINLYKKQSSVNTEDKEVKTDFTHTEAISPQEKAALEEDVFTEAQTTELVSIDDVKEVDVDNHNTLEVESEDDILKTAIKSLIKPNSSKKSDGQTYQAIDIAHNRNIDLSDPEEENLDKLVENLSKEDEKKKEENTPNEEAAPVENKQNIADTQLTLMGASKTGINHLFSVDDQEAPQEKASEQTVSQEEQTEESKEEIPAKQEDKPAEQNPLNDEDFIPEEEISLEDDDFVVEDLNNDKEVLTKDGPSEKEKEVLKELVADKEEDIKISQEEEDLEEAFKTAPALISEFPQENKQQEDISPIQPNNILEVPGEVKASEGIPTTLEELTGKFPLPEQHPQVKEEKKDEGFIPTEIHPDIIVEEVDEATASRLELEAKKEQEKQEEQQPEQDNFLNTFSSDIETVFLDQPTAFISDYVPPEEIKQAEKDEQKPKEQKDSADGILDIKSSQGQHEVQNVKRVKPAAIKTVPIVDGEQVDPFSKTQIRRIEIAEEAQAKIEDRNKKMNIALLFAIFFFLVLMFIGLLGILAQIGLMPKALSPVHSIFIKEKEETKHNSDKKLTPEELALNDLKEAEKLHIDKIIAEVKNYKLIEGKTLEEKIKLLHPNIYSSLKWEAAQLPTDLTYYSVTVSSPENPEGYKQVNYRFNYNTVTYSVEATTSEANNVMVTPYKAPASN